MIHLPRKKDKYKKKKEREKRKEKYRRVKKKVCSFCVDKKEVIDYKNYTKFKRFISDRGKILPRRITGSCAKHQRKLTNAIKIARNIALLPFTVR